MQILPNYEVLEVVTEEEPCTFRARQVSSGRTVLLHRLSGGGNYPDQIGLIRTVVQYLRKASSSNRRLVLDMAEHEGAVYLITEVLPGFRNFSHWLASELRSEENVRSGSLEVTAPSLPSSDSAARQGPIQPAETKPPSRAEETGEFTRMFQGPVVASAPPPRGGIGQPSSEKVSASPEPGKSTGVFQAPRDDRFTALPTEIPTETSEKVAAPPDAGEFTRLFQHPAADRSGGVPAEVPEIPLDRSPASAEPGEFTRIFQASLVDKPGSRPAEGPDRIPERAPSVPSEFTAIFKSAADAESPRAPGIQASDPKEVGDFTRIFGSGGPAQPPSNRPPLSVSGEPAAPPQPAHEWASRPQIPGGGEPQQPLAEPTPKISPVSAPKVSEKPPLPTLKATPISPLNVPAKPSLPTRHAEPPVQHVPPSVGATALPRAPQPIPPKLPPELPKSDERTGYLPWILILGGLVLAGVVLIIYVFTRS